MKAINDFERIGLYNILKLEYNAKIHIKISKRLIKQKIKPYSA